MWPTIAHRFDYRGNIGNDRLYVYSVKRIKRIAVATLIDGLGAILGLLVYISLYLIGAKRYYTLTQSILAYYAEGQCVRFKELAQGSRA